MFEIHFLKQCILRLHPNWQLAYIWRFYAFFFLSWHIIFVIKDSLPSLYLMVIYSFKCFIIARCILHLESLQPGAVATDHSLTTKNVGSTWSVCMSFFVCSCVCPFVSRVCACARWKTPSQCCLNGHAVLWQPYSQLLCCWSERYRGTEKTTERG